MLVCGAATAPAAAGSRRAAGAATAQQRHQQPAAAAAHAQSPARYQCASPRVLQQQGQHQQQQRRRRRQQHVVTAAAAAVPASGGCWRQQQRRNCAQRAKLQRAGVIAAAGTDAASATAATAAAQLPPHQPDLLLKHPAGVDVAVFGVEHLERQPHIGEWILSARPAAVVVETACTPEHGAAPGRSVTCADQVPGAAGMFLRVFCQVAAALQEQGDAARRPGGVWLQAVEQLNGEQLAYVGAFATGALLLFGDRPKGLTYRRLFAAPTAEQLDEAYAAEVAATHAATLAQALLERGTGGDAAAVAAAQVRAEQAQAALTETAVWRILMTEREAVMLGVVDAAARSDALQAQVAAAAAAATGAADSSGSSGSGTPSIALVVGAAHLPGLRRLWDSGEWRELVGPTGLDVAASPALQAPPLPRDAMAQPGAGAKRGLLEALLALSMPQEVLDDLQDVLPPVPDGDGDDGSLGASSAQEAEEAAARQWAYEIYSSWRMQLAALPDDLLREVCGRVGAKEQQQQQDGEGGGPAAAAAMAEVLAPLRALRPSRGGRGWCPQVGMGLRALNFDLGCAEREEE